MKKLDSVSFLTGQVLSRQELKQIKGGDNNCGVGYVEFNCSITYTDASTGQTWGGGGPAVTCVPVDFADNSDSAASWLVDRYADQGHCISPINCEAHC